MAGQQTFNSAPQTGRKTETVKSQRGAESAAQCGTAHQNTREAKKTPVINASAAEN